MLDTKVFRLQLSFEESRLTHLENLSILYIMNSNISYYHPFTGISFISFWISDQTCLFLAAAVISCFLGGILAAFVGVALTARRSVGECENGE